MTFWQRWLIGAAISFVVRQIAKFGQETDWELLKADLEPRVRALVPGEFFDDEAVEIMEALLDRAKSVLQSTAEIEALLNLVKEGQWEDAWNKLRELLLVDWETKTPAEEACRKLVKAAR